MRFLKKISLLLHDGDLEIGSPPGPGSSPKYTQKGGQVLRNAVISPQNVKNAVYEMFHVNSAECCRKMCHFFIADS
ncbi:unnamed protein product [Clavelina lepadiformis]|uniref:Uncharacterized protein n=1 Tax=Clavelina lepadiformis TaxID=159417 RepID=A0ABP0FSG8_CLALP